MPIKLLFGLLSLFSAPAVASGASVDFEQLMQRAHVALTKFDLDSARALLSRACPSQLSNSGTSVKAAVCETERGTIEEAAGQADAAETHYRSALRLWSDLAPDYAAHYATTLMNLGSLYRTQRRMAEAEDMLTQAFALALNQIKTQTTSDRDGLLAVVTTRLGSFYSESATPERGRPLLNRAIPMLRQPTLSNPAELAYACNSLGMLDLRDGAYKAGESNLREAVSVATETLGEAHPDTALYEANLALALSAEGRYDRAEVLLRRARYIVETRLPPGSSRLATILADLISVETAQGEFARAEADGEQSLAILARRREPESSEIAVEKVTLATLYLRERKIAEAAKILPEAVALERKLAGDPRMPDRRVLADGIRTLGELRALERNWQEAQALYGEAIAIYESTLGPGHPAIAPVLFEYADVLKHSGAPKDQVENIEARARATKT